MVGFYNYTVWLTYLGLVSGISGIMFAAKDKPIYAVICLLLAAFCDMFDGKVARTRKRTNQEINFGIQIDSLSDVICFGVLPACIGYSLGLVNWYYHIIACLFVLAGLIRLAYFNVLEEEVLQNNVKQEKVYIGLPITNSALILPLYFCFKEILGDAFKYGYAALLLVVACLFIIKIKIKKPGNLYLLMVTIFGIIVIAFMIIKGFFK